MNVIVDSNIFIGAWHKRDERSDSALAILKKFERGEIGTFFTSSYVLVEVINFLLKKVPFPVVLDAYNYLTQTDRIKIVYIDKFMETDLSRLFSEYKALSLTDCSLITLAKEFHIRHIYSFDSGFDRVKEIQRLDN